MKKSKVMKHETTNHEILLFTGTSFSRRERCNRYDEKDNGRKLSPIEELEKACWNGLLNEMFPEVLNSFSVKCESFIWHIVSGVHFLRINIGHRLDETESETSIDPYLFLESINKNS